MINCCIFYLFSGHILDDKDLVQTLQESKGMAAEIHVRFTESKETEKTINLARKRYLPVCTTLNSGILFVNWIRGLTAKYIRFHNALL